MLGKFNELLDFEMVVKHIFMIKSHDISDSERVPLIKNWLEFDRLHFVQTLTDEEQETCKVVQASSTF